jgi:hypothetical protein
MQITVGKYNYATQINIQLPSDKKRIGVMLSGGADSAMLLYLLALERKQQGTDHELVPFTVPRGDGAWNYVKPIVEWINNKLEINLPEPIKVGRPHLHHSQQGLSGELDAIKEHKMQHVFYGSQQHPPVPMPGIYPKRPSQIEFKNSTCPFAFVDKHHTLSLYETFNIWPLIELTHSCTHRTEGRCGECYNCKEREWAFSELGFTDPGSK